MAKKSNKNSFLFGVVLLVLGAGLGYWGYREAGSLGSHVDQLFSNTPSDRVMLFYIGGAVSAVAGLVLLLRK